MKLSAAKLLLIFVFFSCRSHQSAGMNDNKDSLRITNANHKANPDAANAKASPTLKDAEPIPGNAVVIKDTTLSFDFDSLSLEGAGALVRYVNDTFKEARFSIYGETGKIEINYKSDSNYLERSKIHASGREYKYKKRLVEVKSDRDMKLVSTFQYSFDLNGHLLSGISDSRYKDAFEAFREKVPFVLTSDAMKRLRKYEGEE
jgi:hypothetical protein